jgi:hypothetical protein
MRPRKTQNPPEPVRNPETGAQPDTGTASPLRRTLIGSGLAGVAGALLAGAPARADGGGPLSSATISFGAWMLPLDRHPNQFPRPANHHGLCPHEVTVKSGACINFIISGLHQVLIYDDGTQPGDINFASQIPSTNPPFPPTLIDDPNRRIYRGLDPTVAPQERVEVVHLTNPGIYFVMCGVPRHFLDGMFGFIKVLP